jgi:outer membrane scaffolding protein for murein synthesis (MipA/OmpV family)
LKSLRRFILASTLLSGVCASFIGVNAAAAADLPTIKEAPAPVTAIPDWIVTISGDASVAPVYPGAKKYSFFGLPGLNIRSVDKPENFSSPDDSFSIPLYDNGWFRAGPAGNWIGDRSVKSNFELFGLPYVQWTVQLGGFAEINPLPWVRGRVELLQGVTGNDALEAILIADAWQKWGAFTLSIGPRLYLGTDKFAQTYFSVTPLQSAFNLAHGGQLTPYNANGGLFAAGFTGSARYDISEAWRVTAFGNVKFMTGSAGDSPVVTRAGSRDQYYVGLELSYRFQTKGWFAF